MNIALLQFLGQQILPPFATAMGISLFLLLLAVFEHSLLKPAVEIALLGFSMLPGVGLLAGAIYDLWQDNWSLLLVAGITTLLALPLALWGTPVCTSSLWRG